MITGTLDDGTKITASDIEDLKKQLSVKQGVVVFQVSFAVFDHGKLIKFESK